MLLNTSHIFYFEQHNFEFTMNT